MWYVNIRNANQRNRFVVIKFYLRLAFIRDSLEEQWVLPCVMRFSLLFFGKLHITIDSMIQSLRYVACAYYCRPWSTNQRVFQWYVLGWRHMFQWNDRTFVCGIVIESGVWKWSLHAKGESKIIIHQASQFQSYASREIRDNPVQDCQRPNEINARSFEINRTLATSSPSSQTNVHWKFLVKARRTTRLRSLENQVWQLIRFR